ncbi:methyltransferase type 11 [Luminiphilus syltensis NOR5-1B]|uniref:Methyltransferase type 11 n=1 Tax=Luminiphilus syltensis NOR5-1B TaxID=565045 RepID=B8KUZ6_9GAMM|nr:methyltransferase domain-containing protein [Luminiphilus syltensis]EED34277.1 methyltransferase type 11 [Luminiphilus syltensis NOR5-1B]
MQRTATIKINLACGTTFVIGDGWINLDYSAVHPAVKRADLLAPLALPDGGASLVYSSHFLEHIPRNQVPKFLSECWRVLAPGGVLRFVLPDLEDLCRTYLRYRECGEHAKADFLVLEMIDQCVRRESGGELGKLYRDLTAARAQNLELISFVRDRMGENLLAVRSSPSAAASVSRWGAAMSLLSRKIISRAERLWIRAVMQLLPKAFRAQNISMAAVGECHQWIWDLEQLRTALLAAGFKEVSRVDASSSCLESFPFQPLDLDDDGRPRKGTESMYIEARKPF